jgi:hypothetical protein
MQGFVLWYYSLGYARSQWNKSASGSSMGDLKARGKFERPGSKKERARPEIRGPWCDFSANPNLSNTVSWALFRRVHRQYVWEWRRNRNTQYGSVRFIPLRVAACALAFPIAPHSVRQNTCALQCDFNSSSAKVCEYSYNFLHWTLHVTRVFMCKLSSYAFIHVFAWLELTQRPSASTSEANKSPTK